MAIQLVHFQFSVSVLPLLEYTLFFLITGTDSRDKVFLVYFLKSGTHNFSYLFSTPCDKV